MKKALYCLSLAALSMAVLAQPGYAGRKKQTFTGTVVDKDTKKAVRAAKVHLQATEGRQP